MRLSLRLLGLRFRVSQLGVLRVFGCRAGVWGSGNVQEGRRLSIVIRSYSTFWQEYGNPVATLITALKLALLATLIVIINASPSLFASQSFDSGIGE